MPDWFVLYRESITLWIAVIGFIMSTATWISTLASKRRNLKGKILKIKSYADITYIYLLLENRSSLPIAVTQIILHQELEDNQCSPLPTEVSHHIYRDGDAIYHCRAELSTQLPIQIPSLSAMTALVLFERLTQLPPDDATHLNLEVLTNRGKEIRAKLPLPKGWADQRYND